MTKKRSDYWRLRWHSDPEWAERRKAEYRRWSKANSAARVYQNKAGCTIAEARKILGLPPGGRNK